jgi:hypothetical protein
MQNFDFGIANDRNGWIVLKKAGIGRGQARG